MQSACYNLGADDRVCLVMEKFGGPHYKAAGIVPSYRKSALDLVRHIREARRVLVRYVEATSLHQRQ